SESIRPHTLAMTATDFPPGAPGQAFGARVAVLDFWTALLKHGGMDGYEFYALPQRVVPVGEDIERVLTTDHLRAARIRVRSVTDFLDQSAPHRFSVWHESTGPSLRRPLGLRARLGGELFPVSAVIHAFSYQPMLHDTFLTYLVGDVRPFDS